MRRVFQTRSDGDSGNCFEACVASILDCDLSDVPVYTESNESLQPYLARLDDWLRERGRAVVTVKVDEKTSDDGRTPDRLPDFIARDTPWIAGIDAGDTGYHHAVVMCGSAMWHDPERNSRLRELPDLVSRICAVTLIVARVRPTAES